MHWRVVLIIFSVTIVYAVLGGVILHFVETANENQVRVTASSDLQNFLNARPCLNLSTVLEISNVLSLAKSGGLQAIAGTSNLTYITNWDISSSIFLSFQIVGTVGYGNAPPKTTGGRIFCLFFALIGIPLFMLAGASIGNLMIDLAEVVRKWFIRNAGAKDAIKIYVVRSIIIFVVIFILFIIVPAAIYTVLEPTWSYGDALYFCLGTVLTIGFGDLLPGSSSTSEYSRNIYRLAVGFWLIITLFFFAGLWNSVNASIAASKEFREPLELETPAENFQRLKKKSLAAATSSPQTFVNPTPQIFANPTPQIFANPTPQIFTDQTAQALANPTPQTFANPTSQIFANFGAVAVVNRNSYDQTGRPSLYSIPKTQGVVTTISVGY